MKKLIEVSGYQFCGPFQFPAMLEQRPGVYVILDNQGAHATPVLDVGESDNMSEGIEGYPRSWCWELSAFGRIEFAVLYTDGWSENERSALVEKIRAVHQPVPCGGAGSGWPFGTGL